MSPIYLIASGLVVFALVAIELQLAAIGRELRDIRKHMEKDDV